MRMNGVLVCVKEQGISRNADMIGSRCGICRLDRIGRGAAR